MQVASAPKVPSSSPARFLPGTTTGYGYIGQTTPQGPANPDEAMASLAAMRAGASPMQSVDPNTVAQALAGSGVTNNYQPATRVAMSAGPGGTPPSGNLANWISQAEQLAGVGNDWTRGLQIIAQHESGGNPRAVNNWDSNAKAGHPSEGLMQTIGPTFSHYALPGHDNIFNPIDNAIAAIRYIESRYGGIGNVPGVRNVLSGRGYVGY